MGSFESTSIKVELLKTFLKVNMKPFASTVSGLCCTYSNHFRRYSPMAVSIRYHGVQNERMDPAVPRDIQESHQVGVIVCAYPPETMSSHLRPPIIS